MTYLERRDHAAPGQRARLCVAALPGRPGARHPDPGSSGRPRRRACRPDAPARPWTPMIAGPGRAPRPRPASWSARPRRSAWRRPSPAGSITPPSTPSSAPRSPATSRLRPQGRHPMGARPVLQSADPLDLRVEDAPPLCASAGPCERFVEPGSSGGLPRAWCALVSRRPLRGCGPLGAARTLPAKNDRPQSRCSPVSRISARIDPPAGKRADCEFASGITDTRIS